LLAGAFAFENDMVPDKAIARPSGGREAVSVCTILRAELAGRVAAAG
jgi:hypothetical protein